MNLRRWTHPYLLGAFLWIWMLCWVVVFTLLHPGYNHLHQAFSELGEIGAPNYILVNLIIFGLTGIINLVWIEQLKQFFGDELRVETIWAHRLAAGAWIFTGLFPLSFEIEWLYDVHLAGAVMTYIFGGMSMMLWIRQFNRFSDGFTGFSLITVWFLFGVWLVILMSASVVSRELSQLISITSYFTWQAIFAIQVYQKSVGNPVQELEEGNK